MSIERGEATKNPVCPHCFHEHKNPWRIYFGPPANSDGSNDAMVVCGGCGVEYIATQIVSTTYRTAKP